MAKKKSIIAEKSKPFTSINISLPVKVSVCGNLKMEKKWRKFFGRKNAPKKGDFILENFKRDLNVKHDYEIFEGINSGRWDSKKIEDLMVELRYPNIQEYFNFIIDRAIDESEQEVAGNEE